MSFVGKAVASLVQGTIHSTFVGFGYKLFIDPNWDLNNIPKLALFWGTCVVPFGIAWSRLNAKLFTMIGSRREIIWNLATFDKKALAVDLVFNQFVYHSLFTVAFFEFSKRAFPKQEAIQQQVQPEANKEEPQKVGSNDELYSEDNLLYLAKLRLKLTLGSYLIDMWGPWLVNSYVKNYRIKFFKDLIFGLVWNIGLLAKYYHPGKESIPFQPLFDNEKKTEI